MFNFPNGWKKSDDRMKEFNEEVMIERLIYMNNEETSSSQLGWFFMVVLTQ